MVDKTAGVHETFNAMAMIVLFLALKFLKGYLYAAPVATVEDGSVTRG